jgi:5-methylcytosine-specific restriction endonuclease McrA
MPINYKIYPADWFDVIRPAILKRENYACKFCKIGNRKIGYRTPTGEFIECDEFMKKWATDNGHKLIKIVLTIAHLDHDVTNNVHENLAALCQQCHNRYDAKNRAFRRSAKYNSGL